MKKKTSLKKLDLKIYKISDLDKKNVIGGKKGPIGPVLSHITCFCTNNCPEYTDDFQSEDTSVAICVC